MGQSIGDSRKLKITKEKQNSVRAGGCKEKIWKYLGTFKGLKQVQVVKLTTPPGGVRDRLKFHHKAVKLVPRKNQWLSLEWTGWAELTVRILRWRSLGGCGDPVFRLSLPEGKTVERWKLLSATEVLKEDEEEEEEERRATLLPTLTHKAFAVMEAWRSKFSKHALPTFKKH